MNTKTPITGSSKQPENDTKNNINNNTMTEQELNDMLSKGIKPKDVSKETLTQFVRWRIQSYDQHEWDLLSDIFAEEFQHFAREDFEILSKETLYGLRTCLRANEVYVRKGRGVVASQALANVVQEDIPWPEDDEGRPPSRHPQQQLYQQDQAPAQQAQAPAAAPAPAAAQIHHRQQAQQQQPYVTPIAQLPGTNHLPPTPMYGPDRRISQQELHKQQDTSPSDEPQIEQNTSLEINEMRQNPSRHRQLLTRFQNMARDVVIQVSVEMGLSMGTALRTYHKLYGIAMSDIHSRIQLTQ